MPTPYELIDDKKRGREHSAADIATLVDAVMDGSIPDYQLSAWLMAVWHRGLTTEETFQLTDRMRHSGDSLDLPDLGGPSADKHSTGGVGDKVSLVLAPLAAELGMKVPMLSGRGLGHTGGTLDKLSAIPGYRIDLEPEEMIRVVREVGCSITGQTGRMAPADKRLYHLRDVTATVDCVPLIVSSILSKKLAAGPQHLVIDLKCGSGAFMRDRAASRELAEALLATARRAGRSISALVTDMGQPLGEAVGHAVEVEESLLCLQGKGPSTFRELTVELVVEMGRLCDLGTPTALRERARAALDDGSALARFRRMVEAHGGRLPEDPHAALEIAPEQEPLRADRDGMVGPMDAAAVGMSLVELGGARRRQDDDLDLAVGLRVPVRVGDTVRKGDRLARILARDEAAATATRERLRAAMPVVDEAAPVPLILERIT